MKCSTTQKDLDNLREVYNILDDIHLIIPSKEDTHSRPPRGYVTIYLEYFRLGVKLPLQPYFVKVLGKTHLAPD